MLKYNLVIGCIDVKKNKEELIATQHLLVQCEMLCAEGSWGKGGSGVRVGGGGVRLYPLADRQCSSYFPYL
jgi:hypothetical protein